MIGQVEQALIAAATFVVMLGMGATLAPRDFGQVLRMPRGIGIGLAAQFVAMPLIGFGLMVVMNVQAAVAASLLILSCMPGGVMSNMFTYFARGNLALSVALTTGATMLGALIVPAILTGFGVLLDMTFPRDDILITLVLILVPVGIGMALRGANRGLGRTLETAGSAVGILLIGYVLVSWFAHNAQLLEETPAGVLAAATLLGVCGFACGYVIARALRLPPEDVQAIALETGTKNMPLTIAIVLLHYPPEEQPALLAVVAVYALSVILTGTILTIAFRTGSRARSGHAGLEP